MLLEWELAFDGGHKVTNFIVEVSYLLVNCMCTASKVSFLPGVYIILHAHNYKAN